MAQAMDMEEDPLLSQWAVHRLETYRRDVETGWEWDADGWIGRDRHKLWLKTEGEAEEGGVVHEAEGQAVYSHAVSSFWDAQVGWRADWEPTRRDSLVLGFFGLAPYFVETGAWLFWGRRGQVSARLQLSREVLLSRRWRLSPRMEVNTYSEDDPEAEREAGLAEWKVGMRLRYVINPQLLLYMGLRFHSELSHDGRENDFYPLLGLHGWF